MAEKREGILDQCIVLMFMIALIGYMPTARYSDRSVWVGTLALLLLRTLWLAVKRELRFAMDVNMVLYILLFVWGALSCLWSKNIQEFLTYATVSFPTVVCAVLCLCAYIGQRIEPRRFLQLLMLSGLVAGIRYCIYTDWSALAVNYYLRGSFGGLLDNVTNYNSYTMVISTSCIVALYFAIVEHRRKAFVPVVIFLAILLMGGSRKNIVSIPLIALIFSLFSGNAAKKLKMLAIVVALLVLGLYLLNTVPALSQIRTAIERMFSGLSGNKTTQVDASTEERMYLMNQGIKVWAEHPILGVGWHNYRFYNASGLYAHNNYVEMLASLGIVGFLLYYAIFFRVAYLLAVALLHKRVRKEDVLLLGYSLSVLLMEIGSITLYFKERMILLLMMLYFHSYTTGRKSCQFALR